MKVLNTLSILAVMLFVAADITTADRGDSLQLFSSLKRTRRVLAGFSDYLASAQGEVLLEEEKYIQNSIKDESAVLNQLSGQDVQASGQQCPTFIRQSSTLQMNLAGVGYTNCLNDADDQLFNELSKIPELQLTREQYNTFNLFGAFRGENIFVDPAKIRDKMTSRMQARFNFPELPAESLRSLKDALVTIKSTFKSCLANVQSSLGDTLQYTERQMKAICAAAPEPKQN